MGSGYGSGSELGTCPKIIVAILVIINIVFGALGIAILGVGIWAVVQEQNYSFVTDNDIASGGAILIAAGAVTLIITFVGILGAIFKWRPLLILYASVVFVIVILEITAGIVAFVFRDEVIDDIEERSLRALELYRTSEDAEGFREDANDFVEFIQDTLDCCGINNASDWYDQNAQAVAEFQVPPAAGTFPECDSCNLENDNCIVYNDTNMFGSFSIAATTRGCLDTSSDTLTAVFYGVGALAIVVGVLEIVGILLALLLCCCITTARKQEVV